MVTFKGYTVKSGVKWTVDKNTINITCYPYKSGINDKLTKKTWKNYCPACKKKSTLDGYGTKGNEKAIEGRIYCKNCNVTYCGVTGKDINNKIKGTLTKDSSNSSTATKSEQTLNDKKKALSEVKQKYSKKSKAKKEFKIVIPLLKNLKEGDYMELKPPLIKKSKIFFIGAIDSSKTDMQITLYDDIPEPGTEYKPQSNVKTSSTTVSGANSAIEKTIMLKGKELKSINKIYSWLRRGGNGGFKYVYYRNWIAPAQGDPFKINKGAIKKRWNMGSGNCVFFAWAFYIMCKGAGIKVNIIHGSGIFSNKTLGHFWNKDKSGKIYDCSVVSCKKYIQKRKVI